MIKPQQLRTIDDIGRWINDPRKIAQSMPSFHQSSVIKPYLPDGLGLHRPQCFLDLSHNRLPHLRRIGKSLPSTLRVYQLPRFDDRHLEVPRDAPIHPFVHPYLIAEFLIEEILQCPRMAPVPSSATVLDHDVHHLGIETGSHGRRTWGVWQKNTEMIFISEDTNDCCFANCAQRTRSVCCFAN